MTGELPGDQLTLSARSGEILGKMKRTRILPSPSPGTARRAVGERQWGKGRGPLGELGKEPGGHSTPCPVLSGRLHPPAAVACTGPCRLAL